MTDEMNESINVLMQTLFGANAIADNVVYQLENIYAMPHASDIVHHNYAHLFPIIADDVNKIQILRDTRGTRKPVIGSENQYGSVLECFEALIGAVQSVESAFCDSLDLTEELDDKVVRIHLENVYISTVPLTKQALVWRAKAEQYAGDYRLLDADFEKTLVIDEHGALL